MTDHCASAGSGFFDFIRDQRFAGPPGASRKFQAGQRIIIKKNSYCSIIQPAHGKAVGDRRFALFHLQRTGTA